MQKKPKPKWVRFMSLLELLLEYMDKLKHMTQLLSTCKRVHHTPPKVFNCMELRITSRQTCTIRRSCLSPRHFVFVAVLNKILPNGYPNMGLGRFQASHLPNGRLLHPMAPDFGFPQSFWTFYRLRLQKGLWDMALCVRIPSTSLRQAFWRVSVLSFVSSFHPLFLLPLPVGDLRKFFSSWSHNQLSSCENEYSEDGRAAFAGRNQDHPRTTLPCIVQTLLL